MIIQMIYTLLRVLPKTTEYDDDIGKPCTNGDVPRTFTFPKWNDHRKRNQGTNHEEFSHNNFF